MLDYAVAPRSVMLQLAAAVRTASGPAGDSRACCWEPPLLALPDGVRQHWLPVSVVCKVTRMLSSTPPLLVTARRMLFSYSRARGRDLLLARAVAAAEARRLHRSESIRQRHAWATAAPASGRL